MKIKHDLWKKKFKISQILFVFFAQETGYDFLKFRRSGEVHNRYALHACN